MSAKYIQIANLLKAMIQKHIDDPDSNGANANDIFRLPTESALCHTYNVSRQTVRKALSVLESEHLIEKRQGSGSYAVQNMNLYRTNLIAILIHSNTEYIYPRLLADLCETLQKQGFSWTVYVTENLISKEREILQFLLENQETSVSGILSEGCKTIFPTPNHDLYRRLLQKRISVLFFHGNYSNLPEIPFIKDDDYEGGYTLGKYLVSLGHQKIGGIFKTDDAQGIEQYFGIMSALRDAHIPFGEEYVCSYDTLQLTALRKERDTGFLAEYITAIRKDATAVVCGNDEIAYWLIQELTCRNIRIPDDISVVCFGRSYLGDLSSIPITSLTHAAALSPGEHEIGTAAAESIIKLIKGAPVLSQKLPWHLTVRRSCGRPPS